MIRLFVIAIFSAISISVFSQTAPPAKINFQAAVRNSSGQPLPNKTIAVQFKIKSGSVTGSDVFVETYTGITTNSYGMFNIAIGTQTISTGGTTLDQIAWGSNDYFLIVNVDTNNTTSGFITISSQQLITVPYSFHSNTAVFSNTADSISNVSLQNDFWKTKGNTVTSSNYLGSTNQADLIFKTNNVERLSLFANGSLSYQGSSNIVSTGATGNAIFGLSNNLSNGSRDNFISGANNKFVGNPGNNNVVLGSNNTVINGAANATLIGNKAALAHSGSLLLKDLTSPFLTSTTDDQFNSRFKGGYRIFVDSLNYTMYTPLGNWGINKTNPTNTLHIAGSVGMDVFVATTSTLLNDKHSIIYIKNPSITITLPLAAGATGRVYIIKCPAGSNFSIFTSGGEFLDATVTNTNLITSIMVFSDGTGWHTLKFN